MTGVGRLVLMGLCGLALAAADPSPSQRDAAEGVPVGYGLMMDAG